MKFEANADFDGNVNIFSVSPRSCDSLVTIWFSRDDGYFTQAERLELSARIADVVAEHDAEVVVARRVFSPAFRRGETSGGGSRELQNAGDDERERIERGGQVR